MATTFLGYDEVRAVKPLPLLGWRDRLDWILCQEDSNLLAQDRGVPDCHRRLENAVELGRSPGELKRVAESNCVREPARQAGQREPCLQTLCKWLQRHNRHTCGGAAKGSRVDGTEGGAFWGILTELPGSQTGLARGAWGGMSSPNRTLLATGKMGHGREWGSRASHTVIPWTWEPGGKGNSSFLRKLLMHLREERHRGRVRLWAAPRSEKPIVQPQGLGNGRSGDLQPDAHGCPGKHGRQLWVRCGGGDNTRGGQPHRTFILRGREPIPWCCDRHPIYRWRTEWNAGRPVGQTSEITREPDGMFAAWGVKGPWGRARRRGSYCNPQISQSASRRSFARRETSMGGGIRCQSFHKGKARSQQNHAHMPTTCAWVIHKRIVSVLEAQTLKTTIVSVIHRQENDRNQKDTDETAPWKRRDRPWFALLEFALLVEVPRGIADERDSADHTVTPTRNKTTMNGFVEISTLLIHSAPKQKYNQWTHLSPFYTSVHGEWLRFAKSTSQFHWRFLFSQRWLGLPSKSPMLVVTDR